MEQDFITVGWIVKPQGIRGEVAVEILTAFPERFEQRKDLFARSPGGSRQKLKLLDFWPHKNRLIMKFSGIDSREQAEALVNSELQIPISERAELTDGSTYVSDLIGCRVLARHGQEPEREIGVIADVVFGTGEAPVLIVHEGAREQLIPFAETYLVEINVREKRVVMSLPEGMLEPEKPPGKGRKLRRAAPSKHRS